MSESPTHRPSTRGRKSLYRKTRSTARENEKSSSGGREGWGWKRGVYGLAHFSRVSSAWSRQCRPPSLLLLLGATVPCLCSLRPDFLYICLFLSLSSLNLRLTLHLVQTVYSTLEYQCFRTESSLRSRDEVHAEAAIHQSSVGRVRQEFARHCLHSARSC